MSFASTPTLSHIQTWMQSAITTGHQQDQAEQVLVSSGQLSALERLGIYQRSYRARLLATFHALFPGLLHALGAEGLNHLAWAYVSQCPPRHASIDAVAEGFADYLERTRPANPHEPDWADFLIDLARLETALHQASEAPGWDGEGEEPSEQSPLASIPLSLWPQAVLLGCCPQPQPCTRLWSSRFAVHTYLQAVSRGETPLTPPLPCATYGSVTRVGLVVTSTAWSELPWQFLRQLDGQQSVGAALQKLEAAFADAVYAEWVPSRLARFVKQGLLRMG